MVLCSYCNQEIKNNEDLVLVEEMTPAPNSKLNVTKRTHRHVACENTVNIAKYRV